MLIHQSDLSAMARCGMQFGYRLAGVPTETNSAAAYGSVMHHCLHAMERLISEGMPRPQAIRVAQETFVHFWNPHNIEEICPAVPPDGWLPRQGFAELRQRGIDALARYGELIKFDDYALLAIELSFVVPIHGTFDPATGGPHMLGGSVDRVALRHYSRVVNVCIDDWKATSLDTPIPTPDGWTTMGQVAVGDTVFAGDGTPTRVKGKSTVKYDEDCYRITFDDASTVIASGEHRWPLAIGRQRRPVIMTTEEMFRRGVYGPTSTGPKARMQRDLRIENMPGLDLPAKNLPIDPWVLGHWLGNGCHTSGEVCGDQRDGTELAALYVTAGFPWGKLQVRSGTHGATALGLVTKLRAAGLLGNKHVPDDYLRGSRAQRLALLQGLMDSDGHPSKARNEQVFTSTNKALFLAVRDLVAGLGWNHSAWEGDRKNNLTGSAYTYEVHFRPVGDNCFRLSRKASRVPVKAHQLSRQRIVQEITRVPSIPMQCLAVEHPSQTFLCTDRMTVTHNTGKEYARLRNNVQFTAYIYASLQPEFWMGNPEYGEEGFGPVRGAELWERWGKSAPRRGTWINLKKIEMKDAGTRTDVDFQRFRMAVEQVAGCVEHDIFPMTISGDACTYCEFRHHCGQVGVPADDTRDPLTKALHDAGIADMRPSS